jgi:hypothetical protein
MKQFTLPCRATERCQKPAAWVVWHVGAKIQDYAWACTTHMRAWLKVEPSDPKAIWKIERLS